MAARGPKIAGARFSEKKPDFLNFIGPVTPPWVLYPSEIMPLGFKGPLLARAVFAKSIKVLGWQPGAPKYREHDFPKKFSDFFRNSWDQRHLYGFCIPLRLCIWILRTIY